MNNNEVEQIIKRNNKIEQNMINKEKEKDNLEKKIIIQNKKMNPFIEIIDSSRLEDNIIDISENNENYYNIEEKKNNNSERNNNINNINNINNAPMTFNPNRKNNKFNNSIKSNINSNSNTSSNKNFVTFKNEDDDEEINNKNTINQSFNNNNSITENNNKNNTDISYINNIIEVLKISINKIQIYLNNNEYNNLLLIKKVKDIKNNINEVFDTIIENKNSYILNKNTNDDINISNLLNSNNNNFYYQSPFKVTEKSIFQIPKDDLNNNFYETNENLFSSFLCNKELNNSYNNINNFNTDKNNKNILNNLSNIEEIENVFRIQIINLKKEIYLINQENNNLKQIIQNLKQLMDELMDKNKLLSSKLIKYKSLYEEKIK